MARIDLRRIVRQGERDRHLPPFCIEHGFSYHLCRDIRNGDILQLNIDGCLGRESDTLAIEDRAGDLGDRRLRINSRRTQQG